MGIYVGLKKPKGTPVTLRDRPLIRIHYASEIIRYFYKGRIFIPESIEVWQGFPSETLGGERKEEPRKISDPFREIALLRGRFARTYRLDQLLSTVVKFNGVWDLNGIKLAGFLSINNNPAWRGVYRDIELDAYGRGDIEDLVDALWKRGDTKEIVSSFIKTIKLSQKAQLRPHEIFFSVGVPVKGETENLVAFNLPSRRNLISFLYSTLGKQGEQEIKDKMRPLDREFFVSAISDHDIAKRRMRKALEETFIDEDMGDSVTYFAKERNSFTRLYEQFYEAVFKPAMKNLPKTKDVRKAITVGLERIGTLG